MLLQLAFAVSLLAAHQELGVALPVQLAGIFQVPNLPFTLAVTRPFLAKTFLTLMPAVKVVFVIALLIAMWYSIQALVTRRQLDALQQRFRWWMVVPVIVLFLGLAANLYFGRNLVTTRNRSSWTVQEISSGDYVLQELRTEREKLTGVRVRAPGDNPPATVQLCLYSDRNVDQQPLTCAARLSSEQGENDYIYFLFDDQVTISNANSLVAKVQLVDDGGPVSLRYSKSTDDGLLYNETQLNGSLDIAPLYPFDIGEAFDILVVANILGDPPLIAAIAIVTMVVILFVGILIYRYQKQKL